MGLPLVKDKPLAQVESYRPIALTSCICKLLGRVFSNTLQYVLEKNNLISDAQLGFRIIRGTEDTHVKLQTAILNAFTVRQNLLGRIFFYLKKAYDTTWRHGILQAVFQCGLHGRMSHFIDNFLRNSLSKLAMYVQACMIKTGGATRKCESLQPVVTSY